MEVLPFQNATNDACYMACLSGTKSITSSSYTVVSIIITLLIGLFAIDIKLAPFSWTLSLVLHIVPNLKKTPFVQLAKRASSASKRNPLFESMSVRQKASIAETDFNLHKSNSTFFADADVSRGKLVFTILSPAYLRKDSTNILRQLEREGHKGGLKFILSAVHASFRREILPLQSYDVDSRIHSWDRKWLVVETCFWKKSRGATKDLLCTVMSKIVIKKGRFTVEPARMMRAAGLIVEDESVGTDVADSKQNPNNQLPVIAEEEETEGNIYYGWNTQKIENQRKCSWETVQDWISFSTKLTQIIA